MTYNVWSIQNAYIAVYTTHTFYLYSLINNRLGDFFYKNGL